MFRNILIYAVHSASARRCLQLHVDLPERGTRSVLFCNLINGIHRFSCSNLCVSSFLPLFSWSPDLSLLLHLNSNSLSHVSVHWSPCTLDSNRLSPVCTQASQRLDYNLNRSSILLVCRENRETHMLLAETKQLLHWHCTGTLHFTVWLSRSILPSPSTQNETCHKFANWHQTFLCFSV